MIHKLQNLCAVAMECFVHKLVLHVLGLIQASAHSETCKKFIKAKGRI